jgi:Flp pilus assembly protein TadG
MTRSSARRRAAGDRCATAAVELALLLPVLLFLLVGVWEMARMAEIQQLMTNAVREGARQAATGQMNNAQVKAVVAEYVANQGLPTANLQLDVWNETRGGDVKDAQNLDELHVTASIKASDVRWVLLYLVTDADSRINAEAVWMSVKDKDYPDPAEPTFE